MGIEIDNVCTTMHNRVDSGSMPVNLHAIAQYWRRITSRGSLVFLNSDKRDKVAVSLLRFLTDIPESLRPDYDWCSSHGYSQDPSVAKRPDARIVEDRTISNMIDSLLHARDQLLKTDTHWFKHRSITYGREWKGRKLFQTREGLLGIGPSTMRDDDQLVLFHDASTPFLAILRKSEEENLFIGIAIVITLLDFGFEDHRQSCYASQHAYPPCGNEYYNGLGALWNARKDGVRWFELK